MGLFPQNSYQVIDQCCRVYNHFWVGCVLLKLHVGNVFFLYDTCTEYNTTSCRNSIRLLTFQKSSRKNFLTFHEYTCNDTVTNMIVIIEICVKNKLSTYPEWVFHFFFKAYVYYLCFLKYWQISIFLSYQISSPSMQTHLRSHIGRGGCLWEGWWNGKRFIKYLVTSLITRTSPMDIGYHVTYDNLMAKYCTILL